MRNVLFIVVAAVVAGLAYFVLQRGTDKPELAINLDDWQLMKEVAPAYQDLAAATDESYQPPTWEPDKPLTAEDHPYSAYSNGELRGMAVSDPDAAILLARRTENNSAAERLYERAVALSGKPEPLVEWLFVRHGGIAQRIDGELQNVEDVKLAYEIALTASKLEEWPEGVTLYGDELRAEGVELEPIQEKAEQRFARITKERQELLGRDWEQGS